MILTPRGRNAELNKVVGCFEIHKNSLSLPLWRMTRDNEDASLINKSLKMMKVTGWRASAVQVFKVPRLRRGDNERGIIMFAR